MKKLPQSWDDIKMADYANYLVSEENNKNRIGALVGMDFDDFATMPGNEVAAYLHMLQTQPTEMATNTITVEGRQVSIPVTWTAEDFHFGTLMDIDDAGQALGKNATLRILAIASVRGGKAGYTPEEVDAQERLLQNAPVSAVWPLVNFHKSAVQYSEIGILNSTRLQTRKLMEVAYQKEAELSSTLAGMGSSWRRYAVETRLKSVRQFLNRLASSVSS